MEKILNNTGQVFKYSFKGRASLMFQIIEKQLFVINFFGLDLMEEKRYPGIISFSTENRRYEDTDIILDSYDFTDSGARIDFITEDGQIAIKSIWSVDSGIWKRKDVIVNLSGDEIFIKRCFSQIKLPCGEYEIYSQRSRWCNENEGFYHSHKHGSFAVGCEGGRTCQGSTPYVAIKNIFNNLGFALHVLPVGNWTIKAESVTQFWADPYMIVKAGISDNNLNIRLASNDKFEMPELIYYALPNGNVTDDLHIFHKYLNGNLVNSNFHHAPVIYNTWFLNFEHLKIEELRRQLSQVKKIGCEVFVVDAGWFGEEEGWFGSTGDWKEKNNGAFCGRMSAFADEVRDNGMTFGLWMEPERLSEKSEIVKENPDWFVFNKYSGFFYPDLTNPDAYNYLFKEIGRLLDTYRAGWIKLDYNVDFGYDEKRQEFYGYYEKFYSMMNALRSKYPYVFFEGCAGGGMRSDINTVIHHDGHFLTDTVNPVHEINIFEGALLRLPPGRIIKWVALRSLGKILPGFGAKDNKFMESIAAPVDAGWEGSMTVDPSFAVNAAFSGMMGFTSDIAGLPEDVLNYLTKAVEYYKKVRNFITDSHAYILSPLRNKERNDGWVFHQLQSGDNLISLLFAYRMIDFFQKKTVRLKGLDPDKKYAVTDYLDDSYVEYFTGRELINEGLKVQIEKKYSSKIFEIRVLNCMV